MPGTNARALEKARALPADALLIDLEDAVLPERKAEGRALVVAALQAGGYGRREKVVRINRLDSPWGEEDLRAFAAVPGADAVLVPKVERPEDVLAVERLLLQAGAPETLGLMAMIETPRAVLRAEAIAECTPRLVAFLMGTNDLESATRARQTRDRAPMLTALSLTILAARAHGLEVIDGVYPVIDDPEGLEAACRQGVELGFDGKTVIHPSQVEAANRAFAPSAEAVAEARAVVEAFAAARAEGRAVAVANGRFVEHLHVRMAERTLRLVEAIEALEGAPSD